MTNKFKKKLILIINDNTLSNNNDILIKTLNAQGIETIIADNDSIAMAKISQPDLILLGINIYEICRQLKSEEQTQDIPIIFIRDKSENFDKAKAYSLGCLDYIVIKPFEKEEILARIKTHLRLQTLEKQAKAPQDEFIQQIINSFNHPFYIINTNNYKIELANSFMYKLGWKPHATCHALTHHNSKPCNDPNNPCPLEIIKKTKKPIIVEHTHFDKNGNHINVEVHGFPIFDSTGNMTQMIEYSLDITTRKLCEQTMKEKNQQLNIKNQQLKQVAQQLEKLQKDKLYQLNQAYKRFVPHQFLELLGKKSVLDINLGDQIEREMTLLFSDIRGFTTISEKMTPQDNFNFINTYFGKMSPIIYQYHGFIDKYIGDAIMALFPLGANDAINSAIAMLKKLSNSFPQIQIGIGIHTGSMMLGAIGGKTRMDSTVISDTVNIASRLESLTKVYRTHLLISEATYLKLSNTSKMYIRWIDRVKAKGKSKYVKIFEVFTADSKEMRNAKLATQKTFEQAVNLYQKQSFCEAKTLFTACLSQHDPTAEIYVQRCQNFLNINTCNRWEEIAKIITWTQKLSVHHKLIDQQHQELFIKIKDLILSIGNAESSEEIGKTLEFLKEYVEFHFKTEEDLMLEHNYSDYSVHKVEHTYFFKRIAKLEKSYKAKGGYLYLTLQIQEEVVNWMINHIAGSDQKLSEFLNKKEHNKKQP